MKISLRFLKCAAVAVALTTAGLVGDTAQAQIFCPATIPTNPAQSGIALQTGTCTNNITGAYSNALLASQALSDLSQSNTQETTRTASNAISDRRKTEADRCPEGLERIGGVCRRPAAAEPAPAAAPSTSEHAASRAKRDRRVARVVASPRAPVYKALPPPVVEPGLRVAAWANVFGDYERRTGTSATSINCCFGSGPPSAGVPNPLALSATSTANTVGFMGGLDFTSRNLLSQGDGLIAGILLGYADSNTKLTTTSTTLPANVKQVGNGSSNLQARISGPSTGVFATYFNGGFSIDNTFKADFLSLNENFIDNLAFTANTTPPGLFPGPSAIFAGAGSTNLTNLSSFGNVNYRFQLSEQYWIEPTAGYNYTSSRYDQNAALLGLSNGYLLRLQAGAIFGVESIWNQVRVTTILTGLAYDDVIVSGGVIQNAAFGSNALLLAGEGKIRGQGIFGLNFDFGRGLSSFVFADVRGGEGLFGAGGKAGVRYQW